MYGGGLAGVHTLSTLLLTYVPKKREGSKSLGLGERARIHVCRRDDRFSLLFAFSHDIVQFALLSPTIFRSFLLLSFNHHDR